MFINLEIILKLFTAIVLGGVIGWERQVGGRPAGFRTHILVCLGATLIALIPSIISLKLEGKTDSLIVISGIITSGIITGVGFLGAGAIMQSKGEVQGLTTAASIWLVAAIGIVIGYGFYFIAIIATVFTILVLFGLLQVEKIFEKNKRERN